MRSVVSFLILLILLVIGGLVIERKYNLKPLDTLFQRIKSAIEQPVDEPNGNSVEGLNAQLTQEQESELVVEEKISNVMYQWTDSKGNIQYTQEPPQTGSYKTLTIETKKGKPGANAPTQWQYPGTPTLETNRAGDNQATRNSSTQELSLQCRNQLSRVRSFEKKLSHSDDIVGSIWLQDYCGELAQLIHEGCVLPKKEIKFNQYCPLRYKR